MNKDLLNQLPSDEQPAASKLTSVADDMQLSPSFQWELETRLMDAAKKKTRPASQYKRFLSSLAWTAATACGVLLLILVLGVLLPDVQPAVGATPTQEVSFETNVRTGNICVGPLAIGHGFAVFVTNPDKTQLTVVDAGQTIGELRSFTWSPDGKRLAIIGNTAGSGKIYVTDPIGGQIEYLLSGSEVGYLLDAAWSRDGKQFVMWSSQNNTTLHLLNADGTSLTEKKLDKQILGTPQFTPDGKSVVFYGADNNSIGLFELKLDAWQITLINPSVEDESGFAFSPDGSLLAYIEYDRDDGEARLFTANVTTGERALLGTLSVPKNPGSSLPESAHLSWSTDGKLLVFDHGRGEADRVIYLAHTDSTGVVKVAEGHAPALSADGRCLAYINEKQVFLLDLTSITSNTTPETPLLLADLPAGRGPADFKLDKLQWSP